MCKGDLPTNGAARASSSNDGPPRRVAIIGGGVTGLSAAWHLVENVPATMVDVQLFEAEHRLGGHAYTVPVTTGAKNSAGQATTTTDVDIGFMVYNDSNYPNMTRWFDKLGVPHENTDMSLSVSLDKGKTVEWNSDGLNGLFAKRSQLASGKFYSMIQDMVRFHKEAPQLLLLTDDDPRKHVTTGQYLRTHGYAEAFGMYYLLPMMAALWSASMEDVLDFPAVQLIGFLCNHKMLQLFDRPQWKTVAGRSQTYTNRVYEILGNNRVHTSTPIVAMAKIDNNGASSTQYELFTTNNVSVGRFDEIIFACHTDTTTNILKSTMKQKNSDLLDPALIDTLAEMEYANNVIYVHSDPKLMPARRRAWASWNCLGNSKLMKGFQLQQDGKKKKEAFEGADSGFGNKAHKVRFDDEGGDEGKKDDANDGASDHHLEGKNGRMKAVYVTYWLNRLQNLETDTDVFVSLNPHERPDPELTHLRTYLAHPQFTPATLEARKKLNEQYQGKDGLWFCGAWQGYGFHEDGCRSGFLIATKLSGVALPWADNTTKVLPPPDFSLAKTSKSGVVGPWSWLYKKLSYDLPVAVCKRFMLYFLQQAVQQGQLQLRMNDGTILKFGDGSPCGCDGNPVTMRVFDEWLFVKIAWEYDLGLARSYMAGYFIVEPLVDPLHYNQVLRPASERDETTLVSGDPVGLTRLFLLLLGNRDKLNGTHTPGTSYKGYSGANAINAGLLLSKIGSFLNFIRYRLTMDNSEKGGSLKNIHAHYDLSNDLFTSFLDKETLMYSSAIYDAVAAPSPQQGLIFRGTLEEAQWRKLDTLLDRAQVKPGQKVLDIGFGWGGLSLHAAKKYGCKVTGITLSVEQKDLAMKRVKSEGLEGLITFEVVDYRTFARRKENRGAFDRVLSCEMIEAVGHDHLVEFYWAVEQVLAPDGVLVMEAITTTEERYENYLRSTDFINTIIFPGSCCPSLHALVNAAYRGSRLSLEHIDNIGLHYAQTLADWRRRFNANEKFVRSLGFDDIFIRAWNYYLSYCEAGFYARNVNCLIIVFARQGCKALTPLHETRACTQLPALTESEVQNWVTETIV